jgi:hypothetical protein
VIVADHAPTGSGISLGGGDIRMDWKLRHQGAFIAARSACRLESPLQIVIALIVAIVGIATLWLLAGPNEAWSEILAKGGATAAVLLIFPLVYLWNLLRIGPFVRRNAAVALIIAGSLFSIAGIVILVIGVLQIKAPASENLQIRDLQTQLTAFQSQLAAISHTQVPSIQTIENPAATLRRPYNGSSKSIFDDNLTELAQIINGRGLEAVKMADHFLPSIAYAMPMGFAAQRYEPLKSDPQKVLAILADIRTTIWGNMLRKYRDQALDLNDILQNEQPIINFENRIRETIRYFDSFKIIYEKGDEQISSNAAVLFSTLREPALKDAVTFNEWIEECNHRIELKRKALYEK